MHGFHVGRRAISAGAILIAMAGLLAAAPAAGERVAGEPAWKDSSGVRGSDGTLYTATNHLTAAARSHARRQYLLAWAGAITPTAPDFLAVIDATKGSAAYGKVVNTVTLGPALQNEPHHMQYVWHKGDRLYAGGIFSDMTYVFDTARLPALRLVGVNVPADTPCGSAPDAYVTLSDRTAYASYMGGPNVTGPCTYTNGQVRYGNGFAGSPGEIVLLDREGRTVSEIPTAIAGGEPHELCLNNPVLPEATCANPHGIAVREDLDRMVVTDFTEIRHYVEGQEGDVGNPYLVRNTVRVFDITDRADPRLVSLSRLPLGPRVPYQNYPFFNENRLVMEPATPARPKNKGAFASTMWGGVIFYTPDITRPDPVWKEVFDDETAYRTFHSAATSPGSGGDGASWMAITHDDRFLVHTVIGSQVGFGVPAETVRGMVYVLDIRKLLATGKKQPECSIDTMEEVVAGGAEPDCPALVSVIPVRDGTSGGPHWAALDNFARGPDGFLRETRHPERLAFANYFVRSLYVDGNHQVCMVDLARDGALTADDSFRDEVTGNPCIDFHRDVWPHGAYGYARPHGVLFVADPDAIR
jgi:hypothetical protein